jgi:acetyl/propionyl-CoA carboxylase alpha subunit
MSVASSILKLTNKQKEAPMDQETYETIIEPLNSTQEFLRDALAKATLRVGQLEEHIQKVTQRSYADSADKNRMVEAMQEWTLEALEQGTINESEAEEIAEIMGFELTKEFEVEVTVLYSVTVNARTEEDATNAIHDIDFDTVQYNSDSIQYLSSSIDRVDI